jgi:hypothetical protein
MSYPIISSDPTRQSFYVQMRKEGTSHNFAEMCALQQAPRCTTDVELFRGVGTLEKQIKHPVTLKRLIAAAKAKGYTPGPNDFYCDGLADDFGDPKAFIPPTGGRGHIKKVCEERDVDCHGLVKVKRQFKSAPKPDVPLAENIIRAELEVLREKPEHARTPLPELRESIIKKRTRAKA